jgi:hypothetical protein
MSLAWPAKDPGEDKDYEIDWSDRLPSDDTITDSQFDVPDGLTKGITLHADKLATVWLSGGTAGTTYTVVNRIQTAAGRREVQSVRLKIINK